jgi:hypothetical protein
MAADLSGVWTKIARAEEHLTLLDAEVRAFIEGNNQPFVLSIPYLDADSGWHVVYGIVEREPPPRLGVILGDVLHNVRSALDHLVWQLVLLRAKKGKAPSDNNAFPIVATKHGWDSAVNSLLQGVSGPHRAIIKRVQPYHRASTPEQTYLGMLKSLSNVDKHRIVHPMFAVLRDPGTGPTAARFEVTRGRGAVVQQQFRHGRMEHGAELMRARVEPLEDDTEVKMDGDAPVDVAFGEDLYSVGYIRNLPQVVRVIVQEFEPDF